MNLRVKLMLGQLPDCLQEFFNVRNIGFDDVTSCLNHETLLVVLNRYIKENFIPRGVYIVEYLNSPLTVTISPTMSLSSWNFYPKNGMMEIQIVRLNSEKDISPHHELILVTDGVSSPLARSEARKKPELFSVDLEDCFYYKI